MCALTCLICVQDPAFFKVIAEAYSILSSDHKRRQYDDSIKDEIRKFAEKNEKYSTVGGGSLYSRWGDSTAGRADASTTQTAAAYRGAMASTLSRMKEDQYIRGRIKRLHRAKVDVPSQRDSMLSMLMPMALVSAAMAVIVVFLWRGNASSQEVQQLHARVAARVAAGEYGKADEEARSSSRSRALAALEQHEAQESDKADGLAKWRAKGNVLGV